LCRVFYASSACVYPEYKQLNTEVEGGGLKEDCAWPAQVLTCVLFKEKCACLKDATVYELFWSAGSAALSVCVCVVIHYVVK